MRICDEILHKTKFFVHKKDSSTFLVPYDSDPTYLEQCVQIIVLQRTSLGVLGKCKSHFKLNTNQSKQLVPAIVRDGALSNQADLFDNEYLNGSTASALNVPIDG